MKFFLIKTMAFIFPVAIPLVLLETAIRNIPNDYSYKNQYMITNSKNVETLILGSSHTYLGVNPNFIDSKCFNLSQLGETLEYDYKVYHKFEDKLTNLKIIVVPISYHSLFNRGMKKWKKNYNLYYDINESDFLVDNLEILNKKFIDQFKDVYSYYYLNHSSPYLKSDTLGWHQKMEDNVNDYVSKSKKAAQLHTKENFQELGFNLNILKQLISECEQKKIKVIFITTPTHIAYRNALKEDQLRLTIKSAKKLVENNRNVSYYNFLDSKEFVESDFKDGDHLNAIGAEKFSLILNKIINYKLRNE